MAIFEEKQPSVRWIVLLIAAVFLVSFPLVQIGMNELYSTEGEYAAAACEFSGRNTLVTVHGTLPNGVFPLYPALVRLLLNCGLPLEFSLRFMSLLPLALLALLTGLVCGRSADRQAGAAAAAIRSTIQRTAGCFSSYMAIKKGKNLLIHVEKRKRCSKFTP